MENDSQNVPDITSQAIYQITIKGKLDEHWAEWFNDSIISLRYDLQGSSKTILTLQIRDQSELLGILNRLHGFNLLILQVILT